MNDRKVTLEQLTAKLGISNGSFHTIMYDHLHMSKVTTKWVPCDRILTIDLRTNRMEYCASLCEEFDNEPDDFIAGIVTGDESCVHHFDPETQHGARQWKHPSSPTPKQAWAKTSAGKILKDGILGLSRYCAAVLHHTSKPLHVIATPLWFTNCTMQSKPSAVGNLQRAFFCNTTMHLCSSRESSKKQFVPVGLSVETIHPLTHQTWRPVIFIYFLVSRISWSPLWQGWVVRRLGHRMGRNQDNAEF